MVKKDWRGRIFKRRCKKANKSILQVYCVQLDRHKLKLISIHDCYIGAQKRINGSQRSTFICHFSPIDGSHLEWIQTILLIWYIHSFGENFQEARNITMAVIGTTFPVQGGATVPYDSGADSSAP